MDDIQYYCMNSLENVEYYNKDNIDDLIHVNELNKTITSLNLNYLELPVHEKMERDEELIESSVLNDILDDENMKNFYEEEFGRKAPNPEMCYITPFYTYLINSPYITKDGKIPIFSKMDKYLK